MWEVEAARPDDILKEYAMTWSQNAIKFYNGASEDWVQLERGTKFQGYGVFKVRMTKNCKPSAILLPQTQGKRRPKKIVLTV